MTGEEIISFIKNNKLEEGEVSICVDSHHLDAKESWDNFYEANNIELIRIDNKKWQDALLIMSVYEPITRT